MKKISEIDYAPQYVKVFYANPFMCFGYTVSPAPPDYRGVLYEVWQSILSYQHGEEKLFNHVIYFEQETEDSESFCEELARISCEAAKRGMTLTPHRDGFFKGFVEANQRWLEEFENKPSITP